MTGHALPQVAEAIAARAGTGHHHDAAVGRRGLGRRGAGPPVRAAVLAARDVGDRRQPVRAALRPAPHRSAADRGDGLVLPRHRRRDPRRPRRRPGGARARARSVRRSTSPRPRPWCRSTTSTPSTGGSREGDVACLLMEPALTNIGIVLPDAGLPRRRSARSPGATACCWSSTRRTRCAPAPAAAPPPGASSPTSWWSASRSAAASRCAAYGMSAEVADRLLGPMLGHEIDVAGVGGTLTANALAAGRDPGDALDLPARGGLRGRRPARRAVHRRASPASSPSTACPGTCSGSAAARSTGSARRPRDGAAAAAAVDEDLEGFLHLWCLNRGVLLTPFHNMALFSPHHTEADVDRHTEVFGEAVAALTADRLTADADRASVSRDRASLRQVADGVDLHVEVALSACCRDVGDDDARALATTHAARTAARQSRSWRQTRRRHRHAR